MSWIAGLILFYVFLSLVATHFVHEMPRRPVSEKPDWGNVEDVSIPASDGGFLEVWRVTPDGPSRGTVLLAHGWSRNRDRMVPRARVFAKMGFTTVMHSARDHGSSSKKRWMHAEHFARDIQSVLKWLGEPVILYGHSAGAGGAIIAATREQEKIRLLILEGCYNHTPKALLNLYRDFNPVFGNVLGPMIVLWMFFFHGRSLSRLSPAVLARELKMPVLLIHGDHDEKFPVEEVPELQNSFAPGQARVYIAKDSGHSDSPSAPGYEEAVVSFVEENVNLL